MFISLRLTIGADRLYILRFVGILDVFGFEIYRGKHVNFEKNTERFKVKYCFSPFDKRGEVLMDTLLMIALVLVGLIAFAFLIFLVYFIMSGKKREEPEEETRPRRKVEFYYDEDMEEAMEGRIFTCDNCGDEVSPYDEECPGCGSKLTPGVFECSNCNREVDPRDRECPHCGEILLPEPYVCPKCSSPVEAESIKCDRCGAEYWSPILLDEKSIDKRRKKMSFEEEPEPEEEEEKPRMRRR